MTETQDSCISATNRSDRKSELLRRFQKTEGADFSDRELLELILLISAAGNYKSNLTEIIFNKFSNICKIINAPLNELSEIEDINENTIVALKVIAACGKRASAESMYSSKNSVVKDWDKFLEFCRQSMAYSDVEEFRIFMMDENMHCFESRIVSRGIVNQTVAYPRDIIRLAIQNNAKSLILAHNHPSGNCLPSDDDIILTENIYEAATSAGIKIFDHLIITEGSIFSFKNSGYIKG